MAVSVTDDPAVVVISKDGLKGEPGTNGANGIGFSAVRKTTIDNPLCWLYKKNHLVHVLSELLTVDREVGGSYTDIYGVSQSAEPDEAREEVDGWLITSDETHTFEIYDNIPNLSDGFSCVLQVGKYTGGAVSQSILSIPSTSGTLFTVGTDASNRFVATIRGSDLITYSASTIVNANVTDETVIIVSYLAGDLTIYIDDAEAGSVSVATGEIDDMDLSSVLTINGNFTVNLAGLRFYDTVLNADEITFLS
jgi:hypothetical protein